MLSGAAVVPAPPRVRPRFGAQRGLRMRREKVFPRLPPATQSSTDFPARVRKQRLWQQSVCVVTAQVAAVPMALPRHGPSCSPKLSPLGPQPQKHIPRFSQRKRSRVR